MMKPLGRILHTPASIVYAFFSFLSGLFNMIALGGHWRQSTSCRVHVEAHTPGNPARRRWAAWEARIDAVFVLWEKPWGKLWGTEWGDHCRRAKDAHEARAILTLELIGRLENYE